TQVPEDKLKFVLNRMGYEGSLLRVGAPAPSSNAIGYVNAAAWSKGRFQLIGQEEALRWLAPAYLRAFGPARRKDFQWWAGITAGAAKLAWEGMEKVEVEKGYFMLPEDVADFQASVAIPEDTIDLLPQWDSYTMGYAPDGRARFVAPEFQDQIYGKLGATRGNGLGTILLDGLACAGWTSRTKGKELEVEAAFFRKVTAAQQKKIAAAFEELATFLQAAKLKLVIS
ncbi:MAG: winged helix DNA-binding domain-containing protein, partial [Phaeodactylibacter sp.]|nr:winged helix DNA-binding domain-containing protein [Phaeodactylibacter sp.]